HLLAVVYGVVADSAGATRSIHPDPVDLCIGAVAHYHVGNRRRGHKQRRFDWRPNVLGTSKALASLNRGCTRIDGNHVVTASGEFMEDVGAEILGIAGNADQGKSAMGEKVANHCQ